MKMIRYKVVLQMPLDEKIENVYGSCSLEYSEENVQYAIDHSVDGTYTIDEIPDEPPTQLDIVEAQAAYTAMMTGTMLEV